MTENESIRALEKIARYMPSHIPQLSFEEQAKAWSLANSYLAGYDWNPKRQILPEGLTARLVAVFEDTSAPSGALEHCIVLLEKDGRGVAVVKMDGRPSQVEEVSTGYVLDVDGWGASYMRFQSEEGNVRQANTRRLMDEILKIPSQSFMEPNVNSVFGVSIPKYETLAILRYSDGQPLAWAFRSMDGRFGLMTDNLSHGAELFTNAADALDALCEQMPPTWHFKERLQITSAGEKYYEIDEEGVPRMKDVYQHPAP